MSTTISYPAVERTLGPMDPFSYPAPVLPPPMTDDEILAAVADITYKPGWHIGFRSGSITIVTPAIDTRVNATTAVEVTLTGLYYSAEHVVDCVAQTICDMEDHEFKEWFAFRGRQVLDPHPDLHT